MNGRPQRTPEQEAAERRRDAKHEAGHAVAALHYDCGVKDVSIGGEWPVRGTTALGISCTSHAVVLFAGPLAECEWDDFPQGRGYLSPKDVQALLHLGLSAEELQSWEAEAIAFLEQPEVREQIDRVANALIEGNALATAEDIKTAAEFCASLRIS